MQIKKKNSVREHFTSIRGAAVKKQKLTSVGKGAPRSELTLMCCQWECNMVRRCWRQYGRKLQTMKQNYVIHCSSSRDMPQITENKDLNKYSHANVHSSIIYNNQTVESTQISIGDEWIQNMGYSHTNTTTHPSKANKSWYILCYEWTSKTVCWGQAL